MKTPLFLSLVLAGSLSAGTLLVVQADDSTSGQTNLATGASDGAGNGQGERGERLKAALAQLDLTDAQKEQIKNIRANSPPGKERREQITAVLTPDQKEKLRQMIQNYRSEKQANGTATAPSAN